MTSEIRICHSLDEAGPDFGPCALSIGNFDGVHAAHRKLFDKVVGLAREGNWKPSVLTFEPHPTKVVAPSKAPLLLSSTEERARWMGEAGIEQVLILPFNKQLASLTPDQFARGILRDRLQAKAVVVGDNFRFGHRQAGNINTLEELGRAFGFTVHIVHGFRMRGRLVSSTTIRQLIGRGEVSLACRLLGRPHHLEGEVVSGRGVGTKQTVPTLNLKTSSEVIPATGVYITRTHDRDAKRTWRSITNIGYRPTFGDSTELSIETFLLDPLSGESPQHIHVDFLRKVREERKFPDPEALKQQIFTDVTRAQTYFRRLAGWTRRP